MSGHRIMLRHRWKKKIFRRGFQVFVFMLSSLYFLEEEDD